MHCVCPFLYEFARAFESFPHDADQLFPGWRDKLGVQAA